MRTDDEIKAHARMMAEELRDEAIEQGFSEVPVAIFEEEAEYYKYGVDTYEGMPWEVHRKLAFGLIISLEELGVETILLQFNRADYLTWLYRHHGGIHTPSAIPEWVAWKAQEGRCIVEG